MHDSGTVPIMRLYGVTQEGHSVIAHVHGYDPYFWVQVDAPHQQHITLFARTNFTILYLFSLHLSDFCVPSHHA